MSAELVIKPKNLSALILHTLRDIKMEETYLSRLRRKVLGLENHDEGITSDDDSSAASAESLELEPNHFAENAELDMCKHGFIIGGDSDSESYDDDFDDTPRHWDEVDTEEGVKVDPLIFDGKSI